MGLDTVEFIMWLEKEFEINIPEIDAQNILTVGESSTYVYYKLLDLRGSNTTTEVEIFERIKKFIVSEFNIAPDKINRVSSFVEDLRLDQ